MTNGINLDMKVAAMLFRLAVIVPTIKVEAMADKQGGCFKLATQL
jgi:hypothetical protein